MPQPSFVLIVTLTFCMPTQNLVTKVQQFKRYHPDQWHRHNDSTVSLQLCYGYDYSWKERKSEQKVGFIYTNLCCVMRQVNSSLTMQAGFIYRNLYCVWDKWTVLSPCNSRMLLDPARLWSSSMFCVITTTRRPCGARRASHSAMALWACTPNHMTVNQLSPT